MAPLALGHVLVARLMEENEMGTDGRHDETIIACVRQERTGGHLQCVAQRWLTQTAERTGVTVPSGFLASPLGVDVPVGVLIVSWEARRRRASFLSSDIAVSQACLEAKLTW